MSATLAKSPLLSLSSPARKKTCQSFFKTGPGEYAEGDIFIGLRVPDVRNVAKQFEHVGHNEITILMTSEIHEERMLALMIMLRQFKNNRDEIYTFYLQNTAHINNWDLVDLSAHYIVGAHLIDKDRSILYELAQSDNLWERRIAIVATWWFIRNNDFDDTIKLAEILLNDKHDLMHKATGWMLREAGKKDKAALMLFLDNCAKHMPRTMLRYAIEKFDGETRKRYLFC